MEFEATWSSRPGALKEEASCSRPRYQDMQPLATEQPGVVARLASALTAWTERWVPDAFIFALLATVVIVIAGWTATASTFPQVVEAWGNGFWDLIPFTLQMSLIIITGQVLATSPPMCRLIRRVAGWPESPRAAVALVTLFALASSWLNWGFSLAFSAVLSREVARRVKGVDYCALGAASFLGLGSIWAQGLSSSAALQMATPGAIQPQIRDIVSHGGLIPGGLIPLRATIFTWQSFASVAVEIAVVLAVVAAYVPPPGRARTASDLGVRLEPLVAGDPPRDLRPSPAARLEHSRMLSGSIAALGAWYLAQHAWRA